MSKRTVYLAPYLHTPSSFIGEKLDACVASLESIGYIGYINKIASAIVAVKPQRIYWEGVPAGIKPTEIAKTNPREKYCLQSALLEKGCDLKSFEGLENVELYKARCDTLMALNNVPSHGFMHEILRELNEKIMRQCDEEWVKHVKLTIGENEIRVMTYGEYHHPEIFLGDIDFRLIYEDLPQDNADMRNLMRTTWKALGII